MLISMIVNPPLLKTIRFDERIQVCMTKPISGSLRILNKLSVNYSATQCCLSIASSIAQRGYILGNLDFLETSLFSPFLLFVPSKVEFCGKRVEAEFRLMLTKFAQLILICFHTILIITSFVHNPV